MNDVVKFTVTGKPPKKDGAQSLWSQRSPQAPLVFELRQQALEARKKAKIDKPFEKLVEIKIEIFTPFITTKDQHQHVGDLDNLVAGVFEAIQPASKNEMLKAHSIFEQNSDIAPHIPLLIEDDSQIIGIQARKIQSDSTYYTIELRTYKENS